MTHGNKRLTRLEWQDSSGRTYAARLPRYAAYELAEGLVTRCAILRVTLDLGPRKTECVSESIGGGVRWMDPAAVPFAPALAGERS